jgi:hypothetical protein
LIVRSAVPVVIALAMASAGSRAAPWARTALAQSTAAPPLTAPARPLATQEDLERLRADEERLAAAAPGLPPNASLTSVLRALAPLAVSRSAAASPEEENRALIAAVMFYVNGIPISRVIAEAHAWPRPVSRNVTLRGRHDLAQHFSVSALIAAAAGAPMADLAGVYKELSDARHGSGFSFSDIAADRSGTTFGTVATRSAASARMLQTTLRAGVTEDALIPPVTGLPDNLPEAEFLRRFGGVGAPAYDDLVADINRKVADLPLFR